MESATNVNKVVVFTKENCPACKMTKMLMSKLGIVYETIDVTNDQQQLNRLKRLGHKQLPVVTSGKNIGWSGFRPEKIKELVGIAK